VTPYHLYSATKEAIAKAMLEEQARLARGLWLKDPHGEGAKLVGTIAGLEKAAVLMREELAKIEKLEDDE
jgi:hypothetical protein